MSMPEGVYGFVKPGYAGVAEAFADNLRNGREIGAAFAAYRGPEPLVDLWGGLADHANGRRWDKDTLQLIFSGTKGMVAICVMMLIDRGLVELDAPVSRYWPAFGKPDVLVRDIVSHTARLPGLMTPLSQKDILDDRYIGKLLETQDVFTDPRAAYTYHGLTYGWLCGELVRHVDGRSIGKFFAEEVATPLGLEFWIGLPEREEPRVSTIEMTDAWANNPMFAPPSPNLRTENPGALRRLVQSSNARQGRVHVEPPRSSRFGAARWGRNRHGASGGAGLCRTRERRRPPNAPEDSGARESAR